MLFWGVGADQNLIVYRGGLQLLLGQEIGCVEQPSVGGMPHEGDAFVQGVVDLVVLALQFPVPLPVEELPKKRIYGCPLRSRRRRTSCCCRACAAQRR